jgi:hypothetical protein
MRTTLTYIVYMHHTISLFIHFICVYLQGIVKIKIDLRTKDIVNKEDASNDVEDIGKLAKVLLRNAHVDQWGLYTFS